MTKKVIDYSKCIIYGIFSNNVTLNFAYIGMTTDFIRR